MGINFRKQSYLFPTPLSTNMANRTKIKKQDRLWKAGKGPTAFSEWGYSWWRPVKNISRETGLFPGRAWALFWLWKLSHLGLFLQGAATTVGLFLTSHVSKLPWVRNQGLNHTRCDSASSTDCNNTMTSPVLTTRQIMSLIWSEVKLLSRVRLFVTPWTVAYQLPPSMGFSRQEDWSGMPSETHT